jgi:predicted DNA-binding transcriptional regulator AlpA
VAPPRKTPQTLLRIAAPLRPEQVLTISQWGALAGYARSTAYKKIANGSGPRVMRRGDGTCGVTVGEHIRWCDENTEGG